MEDKIMVSINCITYNHEKYIADAIESFLMQKTNFAFEILIYDDASTDETAKIIKKYEAKYPDLIKPIYQTENQYSKGVNVAYFNLERVKGKYIANCEGDDFWTDPYKLQKQVDYMEKHPECSMCVHSAYKVLSDKRRLKDCIRPNMGNKIFTVEEVIERGGGLFPTNSMLYSATFATNRPDFCESSLATDYPLAIYLALQGVVYYMDEFMSVYRVNVNGSWTSSMNFNPDMRVKHFEKSIEMFNSLNGYTDYKYNSVIGRKIEYNRFNLLYEQGKYTELRREKFEGIYRGKNVKFKIILFIKQYHPIIAKKLTYIKHKCFR